ncbi:MAG: DnaJ domain-containing protein [Halolamina sp.]
MDRDRLHVVLASVMAGVAVTMALLAVSFQPFLLVVALPFVAAAYLMWQHATDGFVFGRGRRRGDRFGAGARRAAAEAATGRRDPEEVFGQDSRFRERVRQERRRARERQGQGRRGSGAGAGRRRSRGMDPQEARRVLGVDGDADGDAVTAAYREKVKETHPDTDDGDEERFKRVTEAYELLTE